MTSMPDTPISVEVVTLPRYFRWIREDLTRRIERYRLYRRTLAELSALSDRDFMDLGIDRFAMWLGRQPTPPEVQVGDP